MKTVISDIETECAPSPLSVSPTREPSRRNPPPPIGACLMMLGCCGTVPGCLGVGGSVDHVGEFAFEESEGFSFGRAGFDASFDERVDVGLGDRDAVEGGVGLAVSFAVDPEPVGVG